VGPTIINYFLVLLKNGKPLQHYFILRCGVVLKRTWAWFFPIRFGLLVRVQILIYGLITGLIILWLICYTFRHLFILITSFGGWCHCWWSIAITVAVLAAPEVANHVAAIVFPTVPLLDSLVWLHSSNGKLTSKQAFNFLMSAAISLPWAASIWKYCIPPSHSFIFWRIMHGKMPTEENLCRGCIIVSICSFCMCTDESSNHLFLQCPFAMNIWRWLGGMLHVNFNMSFFAALLSSFLQNCSSQVRDIYVAAAVHTLHGILPGS